MLCCLFHVSRLLSLYLSHRVIEQARALPAPREPGQGEVARVVLGGQAVHLPGHGRDQGLVAPATADFPVRGVPGGPVHQGGCARSRALPCEGHPAHPFFPSFFFFLFVVVWLCERANGKTHWKAVGFYFYQTRTNFISCSMRTFYELRALQTPVLVRVFSSSRTLKNKKQEQRQNTNTRRDGFVLSLPFLPVWILV